MKKIVIFVSFLILFAISGPILAQATPADSMGGQQRAKVLAIEGASATEMDAWTKINRMSDIESKGEEALKYLKNYPEGVYLPYIHGILAMYYQDKKDEDRFVEHAELAVQSLPDEVNLLTALCVTYAEKQQPDPAIKYGKTALAILPTAASPQGMSTARWEEIRAKLIADANFGTGTGYLFKAYNLGGADYLMTPAMQHLQEATRIDPVNQAAQFYLGFGYQLKEDFESAIPCYAKAAALKGSNTALAKQQLENAYKKVHGDTKGVDKLISEQKKIFEAAAVDTGE
ncbi:MAG: tetratricopeptide repeat protein [bacterium]